MKTETGEVWRSMETLGKTMAMGGRHARREGRRKEESLNQGRGTSWRRGACTCVQVCRRVR